MNFFSLFKRNLIYKFKNKISIDTDNFNGKNLDELFNFYGSDKANTFSLKNEKGHGFSKFYIHHFESLKNKKLNILEIGSYAGASAAAFAKYLPNSNIFCFDINISNFKYSSKKIQVFGLNVREKKKVDKILEKIFKKNNFKKFDIVIDDGSHNLSDILYSLDLFFKFVKSNGIYIIEDYKYPNYYEYNKDTNEILIDELLKKISSKQFFNSELIDSENQKYIIENVKDIFTYKGNLSYSDICFIKKNDL